MTAQAPSSATSKTNKATRPRWLVGRCLRRCTRGRRGTGLGARAKWPSSFASGLEARGNHDAHDGQQDPENAHTYGELEHEQLNAPARTKGE